MTAVVGLRCHSILRTRIVATQSPLLIGSSSTRWYATKSKPKAKPPTGAIPVNVGKHAPAPTAKKANQPPPSTSPRQMAPRQAHKPEESPTYDVSEPVHVMERPKKSTVTPDNATPTIEQQQEHMNALMSMSHFNPTADVWSQKTGTLDVQVPSDWNWDILHFRKNWNGMANNLFNKWKSAAGMWAIANGDGFIGHDLGARMTLRERIGRCFQVFKYDSLKSDAWTADLRKQSLETYTAVLRGVTMNDDKTVKKLTMSGYQDDTLRLMRRRLAGVSAYVRVYDPSTEVAPEIAGIEVGPPAQVVSIRAMDVYLAKEPPKMGNRLMVHALVKFDTIQSLSYYSKEGNILNPEDNKPRRVIEYLVLEKRMWYDGPWLIREKLYAN